MFVGIQVANWNAALADERLGRAYAARLTADLEQDLASRSALVDYYGAVLDSVERTDALLADPQADPQELVVAAYRASEINYSRALRASTWDEIVSSGDIGLLPPTWPAALPSTSRSTPHACLRVLTAVRLPPSRAHDHPAGGAEGAARRVQRRAQRGAADHRLHAGLHARHRAGNDRGDGGGTARRPGRAANLRYQYSEIYSAHANISGDVVAIERALAALKGPRPPTEAAPMILRRVIANARTEMDRHRDRFVIVVLGVFLGIQVANWNEARRRARRVRGGACAARRGNRRQSCDSRRPTPRTSNVRSKIGSRRADRAAVVRRQRGDLWRLIRARRASKQTASDLHPASQCPRRNGRPIRACSRNSRRRERQLLRRSPVLFRCVAGSPPTPS